MIMTVIAWIVLGLIAGFTASKLVNRQGEGLPFDVLLGILGAVIGGSIFHAAGGVGVTGSNLWSLMVAIIGAVIFLVIWHALRRSMAHT